MDEMKAAMAARAKRKIKKERAGKAKLQRRVDMGMEVGRGVGDHVIDDSQQEGLFQLARHVSGLRLEVMDRVVVGDCGRG